MTEFLKKSKYWQGLRFYLGDFILIFGLILASSSLIFLTEPVNLIKLFFALAAFNVIGTLLLSHSFIARYLDPVLQTAIYIFTGGMISAILLMILTWCNVGTEFFLIFLSGIALFALKFEIKCRIDWTGFITVIPFLFLLYEPVQHLLASSKDFVYTGGDFFYYTAITKSLAVNFSIFDSEFHKGIPLSYQSLSFFFPAAISKITGLKAHTSLWAIAMPLYTIFSFGTLSAFIRNFIVFFRIDFAKNKIAIALCCSVFLILLAPLNFTYLLKGDIKNFIFLGEGYLLPTGSPCFALAIWFFALGAFYLFLPGREFTLYDRFLTAVFLGIISVTKLAFFIPIMALTATLLAIRYCIFGRADAIRLLVIMMLAGITGIGLYSVFFVPSPTFSVSISHEGGYFIQFIKQKISERSGLVNLKTIILFSSYLVLSWFGLKTVLIFAVFQKAVPVFFKLCIAGILASILISAIPAFFIRSIAFDENGALLQDMSFDSMQLIRGALFLLVPLGTSYFVYVFFSRRKNILKAIAACWFSLVLISFVVLNFAGKIPDTLKDPWTDEVVQEYKSGKPGMMAMLNSETYSSQVLVSRDVYPWWAYGKKAQGIDYVMCDKVYPRVNLLSKLIMDSISIVEKKQVAAELAAQGLKYIVATPTTYKSMRKLFDSGLVKMRPSGKWFFEIKKD